MSTITLGTYSLFTIYDDIEGLIKEQQTEKIIECKSSFINMTNKHFLKNDDFDELVEFYTNLIIVGLDKVENRPCLVYNEDDLKKSDSQDVKIKKINKRISRINDCLQVDKRKVCINLIIIIVCIWITGKWIKVYPIGKKRD